ncbi:DDE superfamily endonuclease [Nitzschia inconspicua]|uniref:DDE superfamily endonuclease n=1 Tax=Nitzschia inconspicua TaxID=303405 RepID=A0A9K3M7H9_9STRA|nr:DDE superfamily endonuclease [Nitzschia inconspicua]
MSGSDDDFIPTEALVDSPPAHNLRRRPSERNSEVVPPRSAKKPRYEPKTTQTRIPTNLQSILALKKSLSKKLRGTDITESLSLRVCKAAFLMQENYLHEKRKTSTKNGRKVKPARIQARICELFGISPPTYCAILSSYLKDRTAYASGKLGDGRSGNKSAKETRIPDTLGVQILVREFIRGKCAKRERVTARQVLDYLVSVNIISVETGEDGVMIPKAFATAYRSVQRWLKKNFYNRCRRTGNLVMKESVILHKQRFLRRFWANRNALPEEQLREVMLDESYIHQHYHRNDDSLWDPNDEQDIQVGKVPGKGRRYCFAAAIQGANPRVAVAMENQDKAGLIDGTVWSFCPQKKGDHTGDYHKVFNGKNFVAWFRDKLLPNLRQPSLIMMDNAKYHLVYGDDVPKPSKMKKEECLTFLQMNQVEIPERATAVELKALVKNHIRENVPFECERLAKEQGHEVLLTPPYHSDLQPIELVWAMVKGGVGRQYNNETTLELVDQRLLAQFDHLQTSGHDSIAGMIKQCAETSLKLFQELENDEVDSEDDEEGDSEDDDSEISDGTDLEEAPPEDVEEP